MQPAINNAEGSQPLPLFREEALAAREKLQGEILSIRPYSSSEFLILVAGVFACGLGFLLLAPYAPRATVSGSISSITTHAAGTAGASSQAKFYAPRKWTQNIHPGTRLTVHWPLASHSASLSGIVVGIRPAESPIAGAALPHLAIPGNLYEVTVAIPLNSLPAKADRLRRGTKLEAEFPLERRPLLRWLIGVAAL